MGFTNRPFASVLGRAVRISAGMALLAGALCLSACAVSAGVGPPVAAVTVAPEPVVVDPFLGPPPAEVVIGAPAPGFVWVGGYWGWDHGVHCWVPGRWRPGPRAGVVVGRAGWARRPAGAGVVRRGR